MMFLIYLILFSFVSATPRRYNYNCFSMLAEIFPVLKIPCNYGNRTYQLLGKDYDELLPKIPMYKEKVMQTQFELANSMPKDKDEVLAEYLKFRDMLFTRDNQDNFTATAEGGFKDRMRLLQYSKILYATVLDSYPLLNTDEPLDWLDSSYILYKYLNIDIIANYVLPSLQRPRKIVSRTDYCSKLQKSLRNDPGWERGKAENAHELVFRCYDIFPYNNAAAKKIFDLSLLLTDFYVFSNYSSNGIGAKVIFEKLKVQELQFDSSLQFHDFFYTMINKFNDAHISYKVDCYEQFTFVQPIFTQRAGEKEDRFLYISKVNDPALQEWVNASVLDIDGRDITGVFFDFAQEFGKSRNFFTRRAMGFSQLLFESSSQDFRLDRGLYLKRTTIPNRSYLIYTLKKPGAMQAVEVKIDWMVFKNPTLVDFSDQYSYWDKHCEAMPLKRIVKLSSTALQRRSSGALKTYSRNMKSRLRVEKRNVVATYKATVDGMIPIALGPGFAFFIRNDFVYGEYGALVIQTFDAPDMDNWFKNMRIGFMTLIEKGITRLLLDLTGNSGGMLCLAYSLLGVLSPSPKYPFPATKYAYGTRTVPTDSLKRIATCVAEAKIKASPFKLQSFTNLETRTDFPDDYDWESENEKKPKVMNGLYYGYTKFSHFLMDKCDLKSSPLLADVKPNFETIILVSDGWCGSSCAIVAAYLQQHGSPSIAITSTDVRYYNPANLFSFAGGQVVNSKNIKDVARRSSCFDMIPDVLEKMQSTVTYRAIFNIEDTKNPLEYYILPSNYAFHYTLDYANSYNTRWSDFFQKGMEIFENPGEFVTDTSKAGIATPY